ncbi:PTS mannose/fructose/sorbose transporter subunit IIAB [Marinilactibacillus sp. XAAS-LB27]|nr:PTS mannose/fructose/sorbose transporter subunit IIAB [Marinilactibacillus sp. XAAS-LB27]
MDQNHVEIISGMNLPMVLTAVMGDLPSQMVIDEGRAGIKDVKGEISGTNNTDAPAHKNINQETKAPTINSGEPFTIENVRVDARGVHGQVATAWIPKLGVDRIVVIDDLTVKDDMQKTALKMAKPNQVKLSVLSTKKAVERLNEPTSYPGQKLLVIIQRIDTLKSLMELGYHFKEINMGNVPNRPDTTSYRRTVHLTEKEKEIIQQLINKGTHFTAQMVPNDSKADFDKIIQS